MKCIQLLPLVQSTALPLLSPDLREELLYWGIWSEAKYRPSLGSSRDTIQGGQLLQKVLVGSRALVIFRQQWAMDNARQVTSNTCVRTPWSTVPLQGFPMGSPWPTPHKCVSGTPKKQHWSFVMKQRSPPLDFVYYWKWTQVKVNSILQFPNYNSEAGEKRNREKGKKKIKKRLPGVWEH